MEISIRKIYGQLEMPADNIFPYFLKLAYLCFNHYIRNNCCFLSIFGSLLTSLFEIFCLKRIKGSNDFVQL